MVFRRVVSIIYQKFYLSDRVPLSTTTSKELRKTQRPTALHVSTCVFKRYIDFGLPQCQLNNYNLAGDYLQTVLLIATDNTTLLQNELVLHIYYIYKIALICLEI